MYGAKKALAALMVLSIIFIYFTPILYTISTKKEKLAIKESLAVGIKKFPHLVLPNLLIIFIFILLSLIKLVPSIMLPIYLLFYAWVQYYMTEVVLENSKIVKPQPR